MFDLRASQPIMIIEDNDDDYEATQRAFKSEGISIRNRIIRFDNGTDALRYLRRDDEFSDPVESPAQGRAA